MGSSYFNKTPRINTERTETSTQSTQQIVTRRPSAAVPPQSPPQRCVPDPRALPKNNLRLPRQPRRPILATSMPSQRALCRSIRPAPAESESAPAFRSKFPLAALAPRGRPALPPPSTNPVQAQQTIRTSPSWKPGFPAARRRMCLRNGRTPPASRAGSLPHQNKIPPPSLSARPRRDHTFPSKLRPTARARLPSTRTVFFLARLRCCLPHSRARPVLHPPIAPAPPVKRCCCCGSQMVPVFPRRPPLRLPWTRSRREASSRISAPRLLPAPPMQVPHIPAVCHAQGSFDRRQLRFPSPQCSALLARLARTALVELFRQNRGFRVSCTRSSRRHLLLGEPPHLS